MRLIIFSSSYPYGTGEQFLENEIRYLAKRYDLLIIPYFIGGSPERRTIPCRVPFSEPLYRHGFHIPTCEHLKTLPMFAIDWIAQFTFKYWRMKISNWLQISSLLGAQPFRNTLKHIKPDDILYFYWGTGSANLIPILKHRFNLQNRTIIRLHGSDLYIDAKGYLPLRRAIFNSANRILTISKNGKEYLEDRWPVCSNKTTINYLGVEEIQTLGDVRSSDMTTIVSCSSIDKNKRVDLIARCLVLTGRNIEWHHFGTGPDIHRVTAELSSQKIKHYFHGQVSQETIKSFYANNRVDLFVNMSLSEGIPVSMMEALAGSIPIFGTRVGGVAELVDESCGWLVLPNSTCEQITTELQKAIDIMISHTGQQKRINAHLQWQKKFNINSNISSLCTIIDELCD